jgi:ABC-2 type transport system permease protein
MSAPGTITWFAQHELRLMWREWLSMMTAGRRGRTRILIVALVLFALFMHAVAFGVVSRFASLTSPDKTALVVITVSILLSWALMMSQAMESVTRTFYARSDLDLLLSSPASAERIFSVRLLTIAFSVMAMSALIAAPFINVLALEGGVHWLAAYGAMAASGIAAAAIGALVTTALFEIIGAKRTRLVAQIVAAVIGAGFVIALQLAAILSTGTLSRLTLLTSAPIVAIAPDAGSAMWWPARALLGDAKALAVVAAASLVLLGASILLVAPRFARCAIAASGISETRRKQRRRATFRTASPLATLRRKEWALLWRDPWLVSQSLMQLLYLLPPAFLLWRSFGDGSGATVLLVPILVMAAGQLAGGLAWLAISGEDAPELIATAPLTPREILRAKIEAVMAAILVIFAPLLLGLALQSVFAAVVAAVGIAGAAASATYVQLVFRAQAKRSQFRRRQVSSRVATFAEAFVSIGCAATAALAASGLWWAALLPAALTIGILAGARAISPRAA